MSNRSGPRDFYGRRPSTSRRVTIPEGHYDSPNQPLQTASEFWSPGETIPPVSFSFQTPSPSPAPHSHYNVMNSTPGPIMPPTTPTGNSEGSSVSLRQVAESQKKLESMVGKILERITNLESRSSSSPTTSSGSEIEKTRLPPELSVGCLFLIIMFYDYVYHISV